MPPTIGQGNQELPQGESKRSFDPRTLTIVAVALLMFLVAGVGAFKSIYAAEGVSGLDSPIAAPDPARVRPATIESTLDAAIRRARSWDPEVRLFSVSAQFDYLSNASGSPTEAVGGWLVYVFVRGDGGDTEALTLLFERNRAEIMRETAKPLGVQAPGLDPDAIRAAAVDSAQALTIAEAETGVEFRMACFRTRHIARLTFRPATANTAAAWVVSYNDSRIASGPILRVTVDAQKGQSIVSQLDATNPPPAELASCPTS